MGGIVADTRTGHTLNTSKERYCRNTLSAHLTAMYIIFPDNFGFNFREINAQGPYEKHAIVAVASSL
jgi:hypothetical protein